LSTSNFAGCIMLTDARWRQRSSRPSSGKWRTCTPLGWCSTADVDLGRKGTRIHSLFHLYSD